MSKFIPQSELSTSPITPKGQMVMSRLGSATQEQDGKLVVIHGSWQIDEAEVLSLLKGLDEQAPLFYATKALEKAAQDMREALMDLWAGLKADTEVTTAASPDRKPSETGKNATPHQPQRGGNNEHSV